MKQYDVSIVIPIYNCEKYIEDCIKSLCEQKYFDLKKMQVILVNDGSIDNSLQICNNLKNNIKQFNIEVITGENKGVSVTRNKGIKAAQGKYILFLDADDSISENTLANLVDFFDKHYDEIDLITYPMYQYFENTEKKKILQRYEDYFHETRVYDLNEEYQAIQPTMNIMVKNYFEDNFLFNEKIKFNEDTLYNTSILMNKMKIGYVKEAEYIYRIHNSNTTNNGENPLYSFEQYMYVFETLFNTYKDANGKVPKYIQSLCLNVIRYRIMKDKLFPYYLEGEEWNKAYSRIIALLKNIENDIIMAYEEMDNFHKIFLLSLKKEELFVEPVLSDKKMALIDKDGKILLAEDQIDIVVNRFKVQNGTIYVLGYLKSALFRYVTPKLILNYKDKNQDENNKEIELLENTVANRYRTDMDVGKFYKFEISMNLNQILEFSLHATLNDIPANVNYFFNNWVPFNNKTRVTCIFEKKYKIHFKNNKFFIIAQNKKERKKDYKKNIKRCISFSYKIALYRIFAKLFQKLIKRDKKIWLYLDRKNVFDNSYSQFKHDINKKDKIKKYYIVDGKRKDYIQKFNFRERRHLVKFRSFKHKILFLNSDKILTSFSSLQEYSPFYKKYKYYKDILKYDLIYLQHGVLHADLLKMYSKETSPIDKFVISSNFEKENLINNYGYSANDLICTGMPRFDEKQKIKEPENKIIFAPSWRKYLIGEVVNRQRHTDEQAFKNSRYYKETIKFLGSESLLKVLKQNNIILDFKMHPIFEPYKKCFDKIVNENVIVSIGETDISKYKAFITDFSSFQFDFVKLKRPIIYFVPDMLEFKAGLHSYRNLDLKYEDAFGTLTLDGEKLVDEMIKVIKNNFEPEKIYKERMDNFFFNVTDGREKLYQILYND